MKKKQLLISIPVLLLYFSFILIVFWSSAVAVENSDRNCNREIPILKSFLINESFIKYASPSVYCEFTGPYNFAVTNFLFEINIIDSVIEK